MKFLDWFRPGIRLKRWFLLGIAGIVCISLGISFMLREIYMSIEERLLSIFLMISGCVLIAISIRYIAKTIFHAIQSSGFKVSLDAERLSSMLFEKRILIKGPKIVAIGGGTGLSTMLRGLKDYSYNITAVVTVADDGGGSGVLRQDLGMLPPGDIRNCIMALADTEPIMQQLLQYRFKEGMLKGQSFGNLFLAAMDGISSNFEEAVHKMSDVLAVTGRVLPVTLEDVTLCAELVDGFVVCGESNISKHTANHPGKISKVFFKPAEVKPLAEVIDSIKEADIIVLGPGSLYSSIIPNLLVEGVNEALKESPALKIYVCNVMTQPGETDGYSVFDHIAAIEAHSYPGMLDYCIVNTAGIPEELELKYWEDGAETVRFEKMPLERRNLKIITGDFISVKKNFIRHNEKKLAEAVIDLVAEEVLSRDKKRSIDYYYVKERLRKTGKLAGS